MPLELKNIKGGGLHYVRYFMYNRKRLQKHLDSNFQRRSATLHETPRETDYWSKKQARRLSRQDRLRKSMMFSNAGLHRSLALAKHSVFKLPLHVRRVQEVFC